MQGRTDGPLVGIDPAGDASREVDRLEQVAEDEPDRLASLGAGGPQVRGNVAEQPDVHDAVRAIARVTRAPGVDRQRSVLDLEGEPSPVREGHQHIRELAAVHRLVVHLHARLRIPARAQSPTRCLPHTWYQRSGVWVVTTWRWAKWSRRLPPRVIRRGSGQSGTGQTRYPSAHAVRSRPAAPISMKRSGASSRRRRSRAKSWRSSGRRPAMWRVDRGAWTVDAAPLEVSRGVSRIRWSAGAEIVCPLRASCPTLVLPCAGQSLPDRRFSSRAGSNWWAAPPSSESGTPVDRNAPGGKVDRFRTRPER